MQIQVMVRNIHWKQSSTTITSTQHSISIESLDTCYTRTLAFKLFYLNIYLFWTIFHSLYFCNLERSCKFKVQSFKVYVESIYNIHTRWAFKIDKNAIIHQFMQITMHTSHKTGCGMALDHLGSFLHFPTKQGRQQTYVIFSWKWDGKCFAILRNFYY